MTNRPAAPDMLKLVFGGLLQTKQYVISEIEHWGSTTLNPAKMWDDAVRAGRIKKGMVCFGQTLYALDGRNPAIEKAGAQIRRLVRKYHIPPDRALAHLQGWRPDLYDAYVRRLDTDPLFRAIFDRRVRQYRRRHPPAF